MIKKVFRSKSTLALFLILLLALFLRVYGLGSNPPSLYWDEVSQGYNAYSILTTGRDEHEEFFPIARFQAFGDYKAPVYIYLDVISIWLFGQSEFAIRLPSAVLGFLTVFVTYFLVKEVFRDNKRKHLIALVASLLLAISPWHIQLSRVAYEANVATFFTVLGIFLFLKSLSSKKYILILSIVSFVVAFYAFNAHRIFVPLIFLLLACLYWRDFISRKKEVVMSVGLGLVLLLPFIFYFLTPESKLRFNEVNIFSDVSKIELSNRLIEQDENSLVGKVLHNRRIIYALSYVNHYFDFYNPSYLFFSGDQNPRFSTQNNGQLYLFTLPFILVGGYLILKSNGKTRILLFGWLLLAPVAAATARETPHALRGETYIPLFEIITAFGLVSLFEFIKKYNKKVFYVGLIVVFMLVIYSFFHFIHMYFVHMPHQYSQDWQYGYKQAILRVEEIKENYDKIYFTNAYGRAYIYVLWYGEYEPGEFWSEGVVERDRFGFYNVFEFGKYDFQDPKDFGQESKTLYVTTPDKVPLDSRVIEKIKFLNGVDAFVIAEKI